MYHKNIYLFTQKHKKALFLQKKALDYKNIIYRKLFFKMWNK